MPIRLNLSSQIPPAISRELRRFDALFARCEFIGQALENSNLFKIAVELNQLCLRDGIIGYHFTRAIRDDVASRGLEVGRGVDRRCGFSTTYGHLFSVAQRERMQRMWHDYFASQPQARDGCIWFNFTLGLLSDGGADRLLTYFGGEVVYMPLTQDEEIATILRTIGQPLVAECELGAERLHTFSQNPWGSIWLSSYHVAVNSSARQHDVDAYLQEPVLPHNLVRICIAQPCDTKRWRI